MGYNGNLNARATEVITTQGDLRRGDSSGNPERLAIGSANQVLQSNGTTESWVTLSTGDSVLTTQGDILYENSSGLARLGAGTAGKFLTTQGTGANPTYTNPTLSFIVSLTAEDGDATVADDLAQIRMPFAFELTAVRAFCNTAPTGATLTFDIEEAGSSILSTLITIDATEKTSTTATTPPVINDSTLADDAIISFNCDQIGSTVAGAGIKLVLIGYQIV
jgi:hypothetical protein